MSDQKKHIQKAVKGKSEQVLIVTKSKEPVSATLFSKKLKKVNKLLEKSVLVYA